jgi:transmembrane sensor
MTAMQRRLELESRTVAEQAAEWLLILDEGDAEDQAAFSDWLLRSPLHVSAFLQATAVSRLGAEFDLAKDIAVNMGPFPDVPDIEPAREEAARPARRFGWRRLALAASVAAIALVAGAVLTLRNLSDDEWRHYSAAVGEQRVLELEDGSTMYLEPGSSVDVRIEPEERRLLLLAGGAMFKVQSDKTRPFRVHVNRGVIEAVGTQFSVNRVRNTSVVSVVEGVVKVSRTPTIVEKLVAPAHIAPVRLVAGQETRLTEDGSAAAPRPANVDPVKNWKERRLTFVNEPLFAIAGEFNRYNRAPKIRVSDANRSPRRGHRNFLAGVGRSCPVYRGEATVGETLPCAECALASDTDTVRALTN